MAEYYTDRKLPGVGVAIGLTRLFDKLNELNAIKSEKISIAKVLVVSMVEDMSKSLEIATKLRNAGIETEVYIENKKIKAKFKYADRLQIPYVIVVGEEEITNNVVTLKDMKTGEQQTLKLEDAIKTINE